MQAAENSSSSTDDTFSGGQSRLNFLVCLQGLYGKECGRKEGMGMPAGDWRNRVYSPVRLLPLERSSISH